MRTRNPLSSRRARPRLEPLEHRDLLAARLTLAGTQTLAVNANVNASSNATTGESEMFADVNPTDPLNVVGLVHNVSNLNQLQVFFTRDGGLTWTRRIITGCTPCSPGFINDGFPNGTRFDPTIAFDANGALYVGYGLGNRLIIARSLDGGDTFDDFSVVFQETGLDKWHMGTGPSGTGHEAVYIAWTRNSGGQRIGVAGRRYDVDAGWTVVPVANDAGVPNSNLFGHAGVGPHGELYVSWHNYGNGRLYIDRDLDGFFVNGAVLGTDVMVRDGMTLGIRNSLPVQARRGVSSNPILSIDRSDGAHNGRVYLAFGDRIAPGSTDTDIYLAWSDDRGATWTVPDAGERGNVESSLTTDWHPTVTVDQDTGAVGVAYYSGQGLASNQQTNLWLASSIDGGATFVKARVSSQESRPASLANANEFLEYIGLAARHGTFHPFWADNRGATPGTYRTDPESYSASVCTASPENALAVTGTPDADTIELRRSARNGAFAEVVVNGRTEWVGLWCALGSVAIDAGAGEDAILIESTAADLPLTVATGAGDDTVTVGPLGDVQAIVTIDGQGGADTLVSAAVDSFAVFVIIAADTGVLVGEGQGVVTFIGVANLIGGDGEDWFYFVDGQGLSGFVDGRGGGDTLDYSSWTTDVYVDLAGFAASGTLYVLNMANAIGGAGDDSFHGDAQDNLFFGVAGSDRLIGGPGNDYLDGGTGADLVFGGVGADVLDGGLGEDLLIDGATAYDNDVTALGEIWSEWARDDVDYLGRIDHLRNGTGLSTYVLDSTAVAPDSDADTLLGGDGLDWFWALEGLDVLDRSAAKEALN